MAINANILVTEVVARFVSSPSEQVFSFDNVKT